MRQSKLFTKTTKDISADEVSTNAQLLLKAGFIHKELAGVYSYLPLGFRVIEKIKQIIREELGAIGAQEFSMTALQGKEIWEKTGRWSDEVVDNWFKTNLKNRTELGLAFTHEEPIANIMKSFVSSYRDLPILAYQFQTKFRNEMRAKSGIMRGREFIMKDLYSFHRDKEEHDKFYDQMKEVYMKIFTRIGIGDKTFLTMSSGVPFSKYSFEFQTLTDAGEDIIMYDESKRLAINKQDYSDEIFTDFGFNKEDFNFKEAKSSEVGDIYSLGYKYSSALGLNFTDQDGQVKDVYMGSYGIGVPRVMGTVVEVSHDKSGIIWPMAIAPAQVHLILLGTSQEVLNSAEELYQELQKQGIEVIFDDRQESAGSKLKDADLIGIPIRLIISEKTMAQGAVEAKMRAESEAQMIERSKIVEYIKSKI